MTHKIAKVSTYIAGQRRLKIEVEQLYDGFANIELRQDAQDQVCDLKLWHKRIMMSSYILLL